MKKTNKKYIRNRITEMFNNNYWDDVTCYMIASIVTFGKSLGIEKEKLRSTLHSVVNKSIDSEYSIKIED